jgi:hypothetical protein
MSASRPLSLPPPASPRPSHPRWLEDLARYLADDDSVPLGPQLVWVVVPPDERHPDPVLSHSALDPDDPTGDLYGRVTPPDVETIGFVGEVRARPLEGPAPRRIAREGRLVYLVDRDGTEVRALPSGPRTPAAVTAPTREPSAAPIADTCRRMLGLPTAPPPLHSTRWWVDRWVERVFAHAISGGRSSWPALATATLGTARSTPAAIARAAVELGHEVSWADVHRRTVERARVHAEGDVACACLPEIWPFDDPDVLAWMDTGAFARARLGGQPPLSMFLDALDDLLQPGVGDQVRATVALALGEARSSASR